MQTNNQKKSSGFLTIVAFVMVLFGVGYIFSCLLGSTTLAKDTGNQIISAEDATKPSDLQGKEDQENNFAGVEESVAQRAVSGWNKLVGKNDSTHPLTVTLPEKENLTAPSDEVTSGYEDTSTTNTEGLPIQLSFADNYIIPSIYQDISTSSYQDAITILYSNGIIQSNSKFYPHNYVRVSDFIRVVMDAYRVQLGKEPSNLEGLTTNFYFSDPNFDSEVLMRVNSAYELGFLQSFDLKDSEGNLRLNAFITPQEAINILTKIKEKSPNLIQNIPALSFDSKETLRKDEMCGLVVSAFGLELNEGSLAMFSDISESPYQSDIQMLARLGIVGGVDGKFYPNAKIENKDFVIMIARTLMNQSDSKPTIKDFYYLTPLLNDTNTNAYTSYAPYLEFCLESQVCNSLLTQTSSGVSFEPNKLLSQGEIASILSTSSKNKLIFAGSGNELITRGEVAKLIVDAFDLRNKNGNQTTNNLAENKTNTSGNNKSSLSSLRADFQNMMKIS